MSDDSVDIWRRFYIRTWSDKRVMALSRPPPNGQTLLTWLIAGKQTGPIPGLFEIGEAAFAEMLGWPLHGGENLLNHKQSIADGLPLGFREAFAEVSAMGFVKADWKARLVYVPNAIKHDPPQSVNVVKRWAKTWRLLPECDLKDEATTELVAYLDAMGDAFGVAFREATRMASAIQESGVRSQDTGGGKRKRRAETPPPIRTMVDAKATYQVETKDAKALFDHWDGERASIRKYNTTMVPSAASLDTCRRILALAGEGGLDLAKRAASSLVVTDREFYRDRHWALWILEKDFEEHAEAPRNRVPKSESMAERIEAERRATADQLARDEALAAGAP